MECRNRSLIRAKAIRDDEFYTRYEDIEKELGVQIEEEYTDKWRTVKDVLDTVEFLMLKKRGDA